MSVRPYRARSLPALVVVVVGVTVSSSVSVAAAGSSPENRSSATVAIGPTDWAAYEHGPAHSSASFKDPAISPSTVASLHPVWRFTAAPATKAGQPKPRFDASPTVANGVVYVGSRTGIFSALSAATGAVLWERSLDFGGTSLCKAKGIVGTSTVAPDPVSGSLTVYTPGAHYLYALDAATGSQRWKVAIGPATAAGNAAYFNWASPTVIGGKIYIGLAANCESHLIRGGVVQVDQHTGRTLRTYYAVPQGKVGASVWSSAAADGTSVWVTTGNPDPTGAAVYDSYSIVRLSAATLAKQELWTVPASITADLDFGSSPTIFRPLVGGTATTLVGACNKNGVFYAWRANALAAGPVWQRTVGKSAVGDGGCLTSAAYDGPAQRLYVAANQTVVGGRDVMGSVRSLNPATGAVVWETPLGCLPVGSPTLNATTKVLAVPLYACSGASRPGVAFFNATTGAALRTITTAGSVFAQPVFAGGRMFIADGSGVLTAYSP